MVVYKGEDLSGKFFGYWEVIKPIREEYPYKGGSKSRWVWVCRCKCGKERAQRRESLIKGFTKSCGCMALLFMHEARIKPDQHRLKWAAYRNYKSAAKRRGYGFSLSFDEFKVLMASDCHYCGMPPSLVYKDDYLEKASSFYKAQARDFLYNGVDRVDNRLGYTSENCVAACGPCNRSKHAMTLENWLKWISRLYEYQFSKGDRNAPKAQD